MPRCGRLPLSDSCQRQLQCLASPPAPPPSLHPGPTACIFVRLSVCLSYLLRRLITTTPTRLAAIPMQASTDSAPDDVAAKKQGAAGATAAKEPEALPKPTRRRHRGR